jgi:Ca2+-binding EF-hand superfamily protein
LLDKYMESLDIDKSKDLDAHEARSLINSMLKMLKEFTSQAPEGEQLALEKSFLGDRERVTAGIFSRLDKDGDGMLSRAELAVPFLQLL